MSSGLYDQFDGRPNESPEYCFLVAVRIEAGAICDYKSKDTFLARFVSEEPEETRAQWFSSAEQADAWWAYNSSAHCACKWTRLTIEEFEGYRLARRLEGDD